MKIVSLNMRAYPNSPRSQAERLARLLAEHEPDIALLQECRRTWLKVVCEATELEGVHAHKIEPQVPANEFSPDGCMIAIRPPLRIEESWRVDPDYFLPDAVHRVIGGQPPKDMKPIPKRLRFRYSGRALLARLSYDGDTFVVGSFHATPGTGVIGGGRVGQWKVYFHAGVAIALSELKLPFLFALDANEPAAETLEGPVGETPVGGWGWKVGQLIGPKPLHRARDLLRETMERSGDMPASEKVLVVTYDTGAEDGQRRFDSIWATPEFSIEEFETHYEAAREAGGDHALLAAEVRL